MTMPYNNYFPAGYQPMYYPQYGYNQPQQNQPVQPIQQNVPQNVPANQPINSNLIWVQGEAGAKSYQVAPNTAVQLWDSENQTIYLKSADANGIPSIKTLDYTIREAMPNNNAAIVSNFDSSAFATKDEVNTLAQQLAALQGKIDGIMSKPAGRPKKEVSDE